MHSTLGQQKFFSLLLVSSLKTILEVIVLLTDTVLAGHFVGETGISAMNVITPVASITAFIGTTTAIGVSICYAEAMGRADKKRADELFGMSLLLAVVSGLSIFVLTEIGIDNYLLFLRLDAEPLDKTEVIADVYEYYAVYKFALILEPVMVLLSTMVFNDGDEVISNAESIIDIFGNLIMSLILTWYFGMGMKELALGTLLSYVFSTILLLQHFFRKSNSLYPRMHFSFRDLWDFFRLGFADSALYLMWSVLLVAINKITIESLGSKFLPVNSMLISVSELSMVFDGIAQAVIPIVGVYYWEGNHKPVRKIMGSAVKLSLIEGAVFSVILFVFADYVPEAFGIKDPEILGACVRAVRIVSTTLIFSSLLYLFETYYMTQGKSFVVVMSLFTRNLGFAVVLAVLLGSLLGIDGVAWGVALAQPAAFVFCTVLLCAIYGRKNFPLYLEGQDYIADYDVLLTQENIMSTTGKAEKFMTAHNVPGNVMHKIMLLIEETGMLIIERNPDKRILAEYTIELHEDKSAKLTVRDNGEIFDMTDADIDIKSWRSYFLSRLLSNTKRKNLTTTGFNRNILTLLVKQEDV